MPRAEHGTSLVRLKLVRLAVEQLDDAIHDAWLASKGQRIRDANGPSVRLCTASQ
jgi:hypothetical protein